MKANAKVQISLGVAMLGYLPSSDGGYRIMLIIVIGILALSALVTYFSDKSSNSVWRWLVKNFADIDVVYTTFGVGLVGAGVKNISDPWTPLGAILILLGALFIGFGIGANLGRFLKSLAKGNV